MSELQPTRLSSLLSYALLCAAGIVAVYMAMQLGLWRDGSPGPGLFPFLASCGIVLIGGIGMLAAVARRRPGVAAPSVPVQGRMRVGIYMASLLAYAASLEFIGFYAATALVLLVILKVAERLSWRIVVPVIVGTLLFANVIFARWLGVYFPSGSLWENFF